jgi:CBS domain containing-hemolysin-like protein
MRDVLLVCILLLLNAFFVAAEYALVALRSSQIKSIELAGWKRTARHLAGLRKEMNSTLGAIQVGITMMNLLLGWLGEPVISRGISYLIGSVEQFLSPAALSTISTVVGFIVITLITVVASELLPKALTLQHTRRIAMVVALPIHLICRTIWPLVWLMNVLAAGLGLLLGLRLHIEEAPIGRDEIIHIATEAGTRGMLSERERAVIVNTLNLGAAKAKDILIPRVKVAYLDLQRSMAENREVMEGRLYSRLPLCNGGLDHVVGIVYTKEFLTAYAEAGEASVLQLLAQPVLFVPETVTLDRLLALLLEKHARMVIVVDEHGGMEGIVTLTDLMQRLVNDHGGKGMA